MAAGVHRGAAVAVTVALAVALAVWQAGWGIGGIRITAALLGLPGGVAIGCALFARFGDFALDLCISRELHGYTHECVCKSGAS